ALCVREGRNWRWNWKKKVTWRSIAKPARLPRLKTRKNVITATEQLETYLESFTEFQKRAAGRDLPWLRNLREDAFARFCEVGFPTTHDEDWRFTNVSAIARTSFQLARDGRLSKGDVEQFEIKGAACQLVFVNGRFVRELSSVDKMPAGVKVSGLVGVIDSTPGSIEALLGRYVDTRLAGLSAFTTPFA